MRAALYQLQNSDDSQKRCLASSSQEPDAIGKVRIIQHPTDAASDLFHVDARRQAGISVM